MNWSYIIVTSAGGAVDRSGVSDWETGPLDLYYRTRYMNLPTSDPSGGTGVQTPSGVVIAWVYRMSDGGAQEVPLVYASVSPGSALEASTANEGSVLAAPSHATTPTAVQMASASGSIQQDSTTPAAPWLVAGGAALLVAWAAGWLD